MILNLFEPGGTPIDQHHSADMVATASVGVVQVVSDPRSTIPQALNALLTAELTDNAGGELLIKLARDTVKTTWRRTLSRRCTANAAMRQKCRAGSKRRCSSPLERIGRGRRSVAGAGLVGASTRATDQPPYSWARCARRLAWTSARTSSRTTPLNASSNQGCAPLAATMRPSRQALPQSRVSPARSRCGALCWT